MMKNILKNKQGVTLIELIIVVSIIGILAAIGIPEYGRFIAKNRVREATNDLLQHMRLARTMAIKENRSYLITLDYTTDSSSYTIGFDNNGDGALVEADGDGYGVWGLRDVDIETTYGNDVVMGVNNFNLLIIPPNGPNGIGLSNSGTLQFNPDGSTSFGGATGTIYFQHISDTRGYTFCVELANAAGLINLYFWEGHADDLFNPNWLEIR